jgi:hypothetical protein
MDPENHDDSCVDLLGYGTGCLALESAMSVLHAYFLNFSGCTALSDYTLTAKLISVSSRHCRYLVVTTSATLWASD